MQLTPSPPPYNTPALDGPLLLLCLPGTLTPGSQTYRFARPGLPGVNHVSVVAEMRENPTCTTFCRAHWQAFEPELRREGIQNLGLSLAS